MHLRKGSLLIFLFCMLACNSKKKDATPLKFNTTNWMVREDDQYPYRDRMLNDLIDNVRLHKLKKEEVIKLLGPPTRSQNGHLYYLIKQDFIANTLPMHTKTLVIKLDKDSMVEWRKIHQ
jgi:hypothetical protein